MDAEFFAPPTSSSLLEPPRRTRRGARPDGQEAPVSRRSDWAAPSTWRCAGWIDGRSKRIDETGPAALTPRARRARVEGQPPEVEALSPRADAPAPPAEIETAKADGRWEAAYAHGHLRSARGPPAALEAAASPTRSRNSAARTATRSCTACRRPRRRDTRAQDREVRRDARGRRDALLAPLALRSMSVHAACDAVAARVSGRSNG